MSIQTATVKVAGPGGAFDAYFAAPEAGHPVPGVVVIQEIFGVNSHMRSMVERFAEAGYAAISPDLFWRVGPGIELGYTPDDIAKGREVRGKLDMDETIADVAATFQALGQQAACAGKKLGITGYCFGGLVTFLSACRLKPDAVSAYYGGGIVNFLAEADGISAPILLHFGEKDPGIPMAEVEQIQAKLAGKPDAEVFVYPDADHGFNCDQRGSYQEAASKLAWQRTMAHFAKHLK